jgi:hypothetical protein
MILSRLFRERILGKGRSAQIRVVRRPLAIVRCDFSVKARIVTTRRDLAGADRVQAATLAFAMLRYESSATHPDRRSCRPNRKHALFG